MGAVSMSSGSAPTTEKPAKRARGRRASCRARRSLRTRTADAPSVSGEELPGVMRQSISGKRAARAGSANAGRRQASASGVVDGRTVSSTSCFPPPGSATGTISARASAAAGRACDSAA